MANGNWSSAKLNGSTVTESSLFSSVLSSDGTTIWHLIAHRRATWIPAANRGVWNAYTGDTDDDSITAALRADPPTDLPPEWLLDRTPTVEQGDTLAQESLAISLNEGADTSKRVIIHAEDLIIYAGSVFNFPGKEVTILARRIIIVPSQPGWLPSSDPNIASVVINTVTPPGSIPTKPGKAGNGKDAYWVHNQGGVDAQDGEPGVDGTAGPMGVDGGSVLLCAQVQSLGFSGSTDTGPTLSLLCDAQQGCNGGDGGDGGNGGNGYSSDDKFYDYHGDVSMCNGGNGGLAGNGGNAGFGGSGGSVHLRILSTQSALSHPASSAFGLVNTSHSVSKGADGKWGSPGTPGAGGSAGYVYVSDGEFSIRKFWGTAGKDGKDNTDFIRPIIPIPIFNNNSDGVATQVNVDFSDPDSDAARLGPFVLGLNPTFVQMLVRRLAFEYDVLFASFFDVQSDKGKSVQRLRFETSFAWAKSLYNALPTGTQYETPPSPVASGSPSTEQDQLAAVQKVLKNDYDAASTVAARKLAQIAFQKLASLGSSILPPKPSTDSYGQPFNLVPDISFSVVRLAEIAKEVDAVEEQRQSLQTVIDNTKVNGTSAAAMVQSYQADIDNIGTNREDAAKAVSDTESEITKTGGLRDQVRDAIAKVESALSDADLGAKLSANFSCNSVQKVLSAAASCLMFTPEARGAVLAGDLLSVGSASSDFFNTVSSTNGDVSKPEFQTQYKAIQEGLNGAGTATAIGEENIDSSQLLLQAVLVQKQQFEAMVSTYYPSGAPADVRIAWDNLLEIAGKLQSALVKHALALIKQARVESYYAQSKVAIAQLQNTDITKTMPAVETQLLLQMYNESYVIQKQQVVQGYLNAVRAIVALKLCRTTITRSLLRLGCWDNVTGALFNDVILPQLQAENTILTKMDDYFTPIKTKFSGSITKEEYPDYFGFQRTQGADGSSTLTRIKDMVPFSFLITTSNCFKILGIDPKMQFDVRMYSCQVILKGAKLRDESPEQLVIDVTVGFTGACTVTNGQSQTITDPDSGETHTTWVEYVFETGAITTGNRWSYNRGDPQDTMPDSQIDTNRLRLIELDANDPTVSRPVQTPLAEWQVSWDDQVVDVSGVTSVWFEVDAVYRPISQMFLTKSDEGVQGTAKTSLPSQNMVIAMEAVTPTPLAISNVRLDPASFTPFSSVPLDLVKISSASSILRGVQLAMKNIANMERRDHRSLALSGLQSLFIPNVYKARVPLLTTSRQLFDVLGQAGQDRVKNMDPDSPVYQSVMLDFHKALISQYHSLASASRYSDIITDFRVNNNHEAWISSMLNIGSYATSMVWDETVVLAMIKALPMGSTVIYGEHQDAIMKLPPLQQLSYIWKNIDDIRDAEPAFLTSGDSAAGKLVLLGLHNLIGLSKMMSYTDKDVELVGFNATTTGLHALDGKNAWVVGRNQTMKSVGELIFTNTLQGIHKVMFGDLANCLLGESLMTAAHFRWQVHHRALTMDVPVEAVLHMMPAQYIDEYYRLEGYWTMADFAGMPFNFRRIQVGANTDFTKSETTMVVALTDQDIVAQLTKPDKTLMSIDDINSAGDQGTFATNPTAEEGVMLDGVQVADSFAATANPGDPISTAQKAGWYSGVSPDNMYAAQQAMQQMLALHYGSEEVQKQFSDGITAAINRAKVRLSTADPATWATMTPSEWELAIRNDWEFQREGQAITKDLFVEDIVKQFSDELPSMTGFSSLLAGDQYVLISGLAKTQILDVVGAIDGGLVSANIRYATVEAAVHDITLAQVMAQIDRVNNAVADAQTILQAKQDALIAQKDKLSQDEIDLQEAEIKKDQNDIDKLNQQKAEFQDVQQMQSDPQHSADRIKEAQDGIVDAQQSITNPGEV